MHFPQLKIYLASQSPRRKELLERAGIQFETINNEVEEIYPDDLEVEKVPEYLACLKGAASSNTLKAENEVIISADTIVCLEDQIFGKPKTAEEAESILLQLSGKEHSVITGVCISGRQEQVSFSETAHVFFNELSLAEIQYYIENYQPYDKAGAYAIQEWIGLVGIKKIEGCYFNIMGLPVSRLVQELTRFSKNIV